MPAAWWPEPLRQALDGAVLAVTTVGVSDAQVLEVRWPAGRQGFLKIAPPSGPGQGLDLLRAEHERMVWLAGRVPVPEVIVWSDPVTDPDGRGGVTDAPAFLLMTALGGSIAIADVHRSDAEALIRALAAGLRRFHEVPVAECPFPFGLDDRLAVAAARVDQHLVDQADFEPAYRRYAPDRLFELLVAGRPSGPEDLVVVHGDFCLPNVLVDGPEVVGFLDVGRCGIADRYVDLAIVARSLARNVSPEALGPFFDAYGLDLPDLLKVDFYVLLDEFF